MSYLKFIVKKANPYYFTNGNSLYDPYYFTNGNNLYAPYYFNRRQKKFDPELPTQGAFNIDRSLSAKLSALAKGTTRQQIGADTGAGIGGLVGGLVGAKLAAPHISTAIDNLPPELVEGVTASAVKTFKNSIPGATTQRKILNFPFYRLNYMTNAIKGLPTNVKNPFLKGLGILAGAGLTGATIGGVIGHNAAAPDD